MLAGVEDEAATIAGHPLVRALRRTGDREVWVAADASGHGVEVHRSLAGEESVLAREAEALLRADHPHLVPILDVATDEGVVLVRPLFARDLASWLVARGEPQPGEVVTALAPVAAALAALHAIGAAAGGVTAQSVRLDADGAPLLTGEGAQVETERPTEAWGESSTGVAADVEGWRELALLLADACGRPLPIEVEAALERRDLAAAGAALLDAWPALPLALEPEPSRPAPARARMRRRERSEGVDAIWARLALLLERLPSGRAALERARALAVAVRPRYWAIGGTGAAALVVAAVLAGSSGSADADAVEGEPIASSALAQVPRDGSPPAAPPHASGTAAAPDASGLAAALDPGAEPGTAAPPIVDPVEEASAVLAEREACLDAGDAACLAMLHEPGSPQLAADAPWRMPDDGRLEVVQRLGDVWLLRVVSEDAPASVLVMSTEAGWTLRDAWSG